MRLFTILIITFFLLLFSGARAPVGAQTISSTDGHTAREEKEGKKVWEKLQNKQITCDKLSEQEFGVLGEYYMGQMTGDSHEAMNTMMEQMMGKVGEEQMHVVMGKRLSGCDTSAKFPEGGTGFMPMMWMMRGGGNPMVGTGWGNMMSSWNGFGVFGWLSMILFWLLLILGVVALLRYIGKSPQSREDKTPLDILKERYARGEIDKEEFEEKRKVLS